MKISNEAANELSVAIMERQCRRLTLTIFILLGVLLANNAAWMIFTGIR